MADRRQVHQGPSPGVGSASWTPVEPPHIATPKDLARCLQPHADSEAVTERAEPRLGWGHGFILESSPGDATEMAYPHLTHYIS